MGGCYNNFKRLSCYCCPLQRISEWRILRDKYPNLWEKSLELEKGSYNNINKEYSLLDLEERFKLEDVLGKELRGYQCKIAKERQGIKE